MEGQEPRVFHAKVDASGRIVIPADTRSRNRIKEGDTLVVVEDDHGLHVKSLDHAVAEAQDYFCKMIPPDVNLVDELIAERRAELARE